MENVSIIVNEPLESPLSSDIISLPYENRLENISPITECSDSDLDSCMVNSDARPLKPTSGQIIIKNISYCDPGNDFCDASRVTSQVKSTLQEHASMLTDKTILKDLLPPQNVNIIRDLFNLPQKSSSIVCSKNSASTGEIPKKDFDFASSAPPSNSALSYLSISSTPKKSQSEPILTSRTMPSSHSSEDNTGQSSKHVKFSFPLNNFMEAKPIYETSKTTSTGIYSSAGTLYSNNAGIGHNSFSCSTDHVLNRLNEIRQHLDINNAKSSDEESVPELQPLGLLFHTKLNSQKQRIKDLEEELALNDASLAKLTRELEIVQIRLSRREDQLKEAVVQLEKLQSEWQGTRQQLIYGKNTYKSQAEKLQKILESVSSEKDHLHIEVKDLQEKCKNYSNLQIEAAEIKIQLTATTKSYNEIMDENKRINDKLKDYDKKTTFYEEQIESLTEESSRIHQQLAEVTSRNNKLEQDYASLDDRHAILLEKTLEEEQSKEKAQQETVVFIGELNKLKNDSLTVKDCLHKYYQEQLETIVKQRTQELQGQIDSLESQLNEKFSKETELLKGNHSREIQDIHRRYMEELNTLKVQHDTKEGKLILDIKTLQKQNKILQQQRQVILSAVTSVIPQTELNFTHPEQLRDYIPSRNHLGLPTNNGQLMQNIVGAQEPLPVFNSDRTNVFPPLKTKRKDVQKRSHIRDRPLITSTSFSSVSDAAFEDDLSPPDGRVTSRERKITNQRQQNEKVRMRVNMKFPDELSRSPSLGKRIYKASEILDCVNTQCSDISSKTGRLPPQKFLAEVDRTMAELVEEINSLSSIQPPSNFVGETPRHDTSLEQDSAQFTLNRIEKVSSMLANYVNK